MRSEIENLIAPFIAPDGLGHLSTDEKDRRIGPRGPSVHNENGLLFRAFIKVQLHRAFGIINDFEGELVSSCEERPGLLNRWPGINSEPDQHDNYIGAVILSPDHAQRFIDYAWKNRFCFNNVQPGKFRLDCVRQPGELAVYYVRAQKKPPFLFYAWLMTGLWLNAWKKRSPGQTQLAWLRIFILDIEGFDTPTYRFVRAYWFAQLKKHYGKLSNVFGQYFEAGHPVNVLQKLIEERENV